MKPAPFEYRAPTTVPEALEALGEAPDETSLLAGGQSLVPLLNMRLARPSILVDLNRVAELDRIDVNGRVHIGAMVRQRTLEVDARVREHLPLLAETAAHIAHLPIRTRGTVGGSLAHADPAAELPAAMLVLDATMVVRGSDGEARSVPAHEFFVGPLTTAVGPGELLVGVHVDVPPRGTGSGFAEVARTHGAFALAGAAALVRLDERDRIDHVRVALCGVGPTPYAPPWLDELIGETASEAVFADVGARVAAGITPRDDVHGTAAYRREIARVVTARALRSAAKRGRPK